MFLSALLLLFGAAEAVRDTVGATPHITYHSLTEEQPNKGPPQPPIWPDAYHVKYHFDCPYVDMYQGKSGRTEVEIWRDRTWGDQTLEKRGAQKITRDEGETTYEFMDVNKRYYVTPFLGGNGCFATEIEDDGGALRRLSQFWGGDLSPVLPDLTEGRWHYNTTVTEGAQEMHVWRWFIAEGEEGKREMTYLMYTDALDGTPIKMDTWGLNYFSGGHWDHYITEYYDYETVVDQAIFELPEMCALSEKGSSEIHFDFDVDDFHRQRHRLLGPLVPNAYYGDDEYDMFAHTVARKHASADEYETRRAAYYVAKQTVDEHNAAGDKPYEMGLNRFADWTENEHPSQGRIDKNGPGMTLTEAGRTDPEFYKTAKVFERILPDSELPGTVDWRGTGADGPVKDQNYCGSCWAFSAVIALEAAYYRTYKEPVMLSEQELINCDWKYGSNGCFGGHVWNGFEQAILEGITTADAIPYISAEQVCKADRGDPDAPARIMKAEGYTKVSGGVYQWGGPEAVKEALLRKGPMAINIDYKDSLKWYRSGIYHEPTCTIFSDNAGHAAGLVGYGVEDGVEYWIVKNVWGPYWGEDGYIRITMHDNDCAVSAGAKFVDLDKDATDDMRIAYAAWKAKQESD